MKLAADVQEPSRRNLQTAQTICKQAFVKLMAICLPTVTEVQAKDVFRSGEKCRDMFRSTKSTRPCTCTSQHKARKARSKYTSRSATSVTREGADTDKDDGISQYCDGISQTTRNDITLPPTRPRANTFPLSQPRNASPRRCLTIDSSVGFSSTPKLTRADSDDFGEVMSSLESTVGVLRALRQRKLRRQSTNPYAAGSPVLLRRTRQAEAHQRYHSHERTIRGLPLRTASLDDDASMCLLS